MESPVPHGLVIRRVVGAMVGFLSSDALVVEEDLRPVAPVCRHLLVVDVGGGVLGILAATGGVEREEPVDAVLGGLLNVGWPIVLVDDVPLVMDRREIPRCGQDLLGSAR